MSEKDTTKANATAPATGDKKPEAKNGAKKKETKATKAKKKSFVCRTNLHRIGRRGEIVSLDPKTVAHIDKADLDENITKKDKAFHEKWYGAKKAAPSGPMKSTNMQEPEGDETGDEE